MGLFEKLKDWLMPPEIEEEYEEEEEEKVAQKSAQKSEAKTSRVREEVAEAVAVNASPSSQVASRSRFTTTSVRDFNIEQHENSDKSKTLYTYKKPNAPSLNVEIYAPKSFDQVRSIGDQLKRKNAVVVNYEMLGVPDQRRICDFLNGLIYVLDGDVKRVSNNIVLYVPAGVDVTEAVSFAG